MQSSDVDKNFIQTKLDLCGVPCAVTVGITYATLFPGSRASGRGHTRAKEAS